jgi:trk system potassium uptake protein TrkA
MIWKQRDDIQEFAVIGLGRFGASLALTLEAHGHTVLGVDLNPEPVQEIADEIAQAVTLDATSEEALRMVDIASFETVVVAIGADFESNLLTTVALKELGVSRVICKAITARQERILLRMGADRVIRPEHDAGARLAEELSTPAMLEKLPLGPEHSVIELIVPESLAWQTIAQAHVRQKYGITVLVVKREDALLVSPPPDCVLQQGDILVVLGSNEDITRFSRL